MSKTVDSYLRKRCFFERWPLLGADTTGIQQVVVIPALKEYDRIFLTLGDLEQNDPEFLARTLVMVVVNHGVKADMATVEDNRNTLETLTRYDGPLRLAWVDAATPETILPKKDGVGMARKIGLDWGLRVLKDNDALGNGLISLDADTRVKPNYLQVVVDFLNAKQRWAGYVAYRHPLEGSETEQAAILCYEFFLRYHELMLRNAASPYGYPSIGSTIVCTGEAYAAVSGMNRRQAGEDFYFLQQLAKTGAVEAIHGTTIYPASRPSHRVPFGTGKRVQRFLDGTEEEYLLYHPESYRILKAWLCLAAEQLDADGEEVLAQAERIDPALADYLRGQNLPVVWKRLQQHAHGAEQHLAAFHIWFDGFKTLKLIHHLRDHGYPQQEMFTAIQALCEMYETTTPIALVSTLQHDLSAQEKLLDYVCRL